MLNNQAREEIDLVLVWLCFVVATGVLLAFAITVVTGISSWLQFGAERARRERIR